MKSIYLTIVVVVILLIFVPLVSTLGIRYIQLSPQPPNYYLQKVFAQNIVSGKVDAQENNFAAIGLSIKNPNLKNKNDIILRVLTENKDELRSSRINGWSVPDGDLIKFEFPEIPDSKSKKYIVEVSSPDSVEEFPFEVYMTSDKNISAIDYFRPVSRTSLISSIYQDFARRFLGDTGFTIFYATLLLVLSFVLIKKTN